MIFKIPSKINDLLDYLEKIKLNGKKYDVTVELIRENRTIPQNKLYWLWMKCIAHETGETKDRMHAVFANLFLFESIEIKGVTYECVRSTSTLDTKQFTEYLNQVQAFASSELGIKLPNPEDLHFQEFQEFYKDMI